MIRALIVDDVPLFRRGLRSTLERLGDCEIIGESTQVADSLYLAQTYRPDVVLLHEGLVAVSALDLARLLFQQAEQRGVFVLAASGTEEQVFQFMVAGAAAYESRWISAEDLVEKVRKVSVGEYLISSESIMSGRAARELSYHRSAVQAVGLGQLPGVSASTSTCPLSDCEVQMLVRIAQGMGNKEIAQSLGIGHQTVNHHIGSLLITLGVADRTGAVMYALRQQWLDLERIEEAASQDVYQAHNRPTRPPSKRKASPRQETPPLVQPPAAPHVLYRLQMVACGKDRCRKCRAGERHGPYWFAYSYVHGKTVRSYVGKSLPAGVTVAGIAATDHVKSAESSSKL